jgi:hypothetical protein
VHWRGQVWHSWPVVLLLVCLPRCSCHHVIMSEPVAMTRQGGSIRHHGSAFVTFLAYLAHTSPSPSTRLHHPPSDRPCLPAPRSQHRINQPPFCAFYLSPFCFTLAFCHRACVAAPPSPWPTMRSPSRIWILFKNFPHLRHRFPSPSSPRPAFTFFSLLPLPLLDALVAYLYRTHIHKHPRLASAKVGK